MDDLVRRLRAPAGDWLTDLAADRIEALEAEVARLRGAVQKADDHLTNLQPRIPQACYPGHEGFIDSHVDCAQEILRAALTEIGPNP